MRELPERIRNSDRSTIRFDYIERGMIDAMFEGAVASYGNGESFSWLAGGGEYKYRCTRTGSGRAFDDGTPLSTWLIEIEDTNQNLLHSYNFDGSHEEAFTLHDGSPIPHELANMTINLAMDLQEEEVELLKTMRFRILPGDDVIVNPRYEGDPLA